MLNGLMGDPDGLMRSLVSDTVRLDERENQTGLNDLSAVSDGAA